MKKYILTMLVAVCLVFTLGNVQQANAQHFDYDEAYQILQGAWTDESPSHTNPQPRYLVWKSNDGSECNIVNGKGYTDPDGNSIIYFDYKGTRAYANVTYYPDQGKYYARIYAYMNTSKSWLTLYDCLSKDR
ncbi:MAG: hypothetical protein ABFC84_11960 [Veillonellales bacterium]